MTVAKSPGALELKNFRFGKKEQELGETNRSSLKWRQIMKKLSFLSMILLLLVAYNAMAQDVRYNFEQSANFSNYKTYNWVTIKEAEKLDSMRDGQIKAAIDAELAKKGLTRTDGEKPDLLIAYQAAVQQEKEFYSYTSGGYGGFRGGWYGAGGMSTTSGSTSTILIGQLGVDIYDAASQKIIWRGLASKTIDQKANPEKQQKNLAKAMAKLLKNYPPPVKK